MKTRPAVVFAVAASGAVLVAITVGIAIIGPPWEARMHRLDAQRVRDLQAISAAIEEYRQTHDSIPATLDELQQRTPRAVLRLNDAESGEPYEYRAKTASSYELCARFDTSSEPDPRISPFWNHGPGRHCFDLEARPPVQR